MLRKQTLFKFMSPFSWLSFLVLMGLAAEMEPFVTIGCNLDYEVQNVKQVILAEAQKDSSSNDCGQNDVRGCEEPRFILEIS
jgi:hypothetical protein